jgi:hypothetical protein
MCVLEWQISRSFFRSSCYLGQFRSEKRLYLMASQALPQVVAHVEDSRPLDPCPGGSEPAKHSSISVGHFPAVTQRLCPLVFHKKRTSIHKLYCLPTLIEQ